MDIIDAKGISKSFGKIKALENVFLSIKQGELFGLIGPDGAGKSTLFNILVTLLNPDKGTASVDGLDILSDYKKIRKIIGYLPGQFSLYKDLSCYENLDFFATLYGENIKKNYDLIRPIWEQLLPFKDRFANDLSGGMKQKLALCCALVHRPKILVLDEPTTGVDPVSRQEFWQILKTLKNENITVLVSTSYMDEATLCDKIALIQSGKLLSVNTPQQIRSEFKGILIGIQTKEIYRLLTSLEGSSSILTAYASGQQVNVVLENEQKLQEFKESIKTLTVPYQNISEISPTIEDCFIQLIKSEA